MIRGTKNEGISSQTKQRHATGLLTTTGVKAQGYETIEDTAGIILERRDEFDIHSVIESEFPSNAFNGTFE